jgi:hypothetical protein
LVDLFGKKKMENRILEMQASLARMQSEKEDLLRTLEKREEKIRRLSCAIQEANLALKEAEQKASAAVSTPKEATPEICEGPKPKARKLSLREMDSLAERLKACRSPKDDLLTACFSGSIPEDVRLSPEAKAAVNAIKSDRGKILLHSPQLFNLLFVPPFPIKNSVQESRFMEASAFRLDFMQEMMNTPVLVVSAHAGGTFLGVSFSQEVFEAEELVQSQVIGKHSKGGWSQKRFERLREEDIKVHVDLVLEKLAELKGKYASLVKYAVLAGEESLIRQITPHTGLPVVERRLERHDDKRNKALLEDVYGFVCYRIHE